MDDGRYQGIVTKQPPAVRKGAVFHKGLSGNCWRGEGFSFCQNNFCVGDSFAMYTYDTPFINGLKYFII